MTISWSSETADSGQRLTCMDRVRVYGADWCPMTTAVRRHLNSLRVAHDYVDIEQDPAAAERVRKHNNGKERKPMVEIGDEIMNTPTEIELEAALREHQLVA